MLHGELQFPITV